MHFRKVPGCYVEDCKSEKKNRDQCESYRHGLGERQREWWRQSPEKDMSCIFNDKPRRVLLMFSLLLTAGA